MAGALALKEIDVMNVEPESCEEDNKNAFSAAVISPQEEDSKFDKELKRRFPNWPEPTLEGNLARGLGLSLES